MGRLSALLVLSTAPLFSGDVIPFQTPQPGFEQNLGQFPAGVLFGFDDRLLYRDHIQLTTGLSIQFLNTNSSMTVTGEEQSPFPLNLYLSTDSHKWLKNVPHFGTVRYAQVTPGIDVQLIANAANGDGGRSPAIRVAVAPGATLQQFGITPITDEGLSWEVSSNRILIFRPVSFALDNLTAYQTIGGTQQYVGIRFVQINGNSFGLQADTYDASMPLTIEFGDPFGAHLIPDSTIIARGNSVVAAGWSFYTSPSFLAKWRFDGSPVFLTLFNPVTYGHLFSDQAGNISLSANFRSDPSNTVPFSPPPVTPDAPRATPIADGDGWLARFESSAGTLMSATYTGWPVSIVTADQNGAVFYSTPDSIIKWVPGNSQFAFAVPIAQTLALATNDSGDLAFVATGNPELPTTPGAVQGTY